MPHGLPAIDTLKNKMRKPSYWQRTTGTKLLAPLYWCQATGPHPVESGGERDCVGVECAFSPDKTVPHPHLMTSHFPRAVVVATHTAPPSTRHHRMPDTPPGPFGRRDARVGLALATLMGPVAVKCPGPPGPLLPPLLGSAAGTCDAIGRNTSPQSSSASRACCACSCTL